VDDVPGPQTVSASQASLTGRTSPQPAAFDEQFRPSRTMDRPIHAPAAKEGAICGIHDRIDREASDIALDNGHPVGETIVH
jgi:hypothetical protein